MAVAVAAARRDEPVQARSWLQIRDFRKATRFTRPGVDGTAAIQELAAGEISPHEAVLQIEKDLLDTFQARLVTNLDEAAQAAERGFDGRLAETAALVAGYWEAIAPEYGDQRGEAERRAVDRDFAILAATAAATEVARFETARKRVEDALVGFTAAPLTPDEEVNRASQLERFLDLVPKEYEKGVSDGRVTIPFEVQEAVAFMDGVEAAFSDLEPALLQRDEATVEAIRADFAALRADVDDAQQGRAVAAEEDVTAIAEGAAEKIERISPEEWSEGGDEADYELVAVSLDQLEAAAGAGQYQAAEQARLAAYGFLEFGPELKLRAFDPQLALELEGLIWYGADGDKGLANLVADRAPLSEIRETRLDLDEKLADARALTGEGASAMTTIVNSALIVFREGLEAILIIAAITASMLGPRAPLRRPIYRGALLAIPASMLLFVLAILLLDSLSKYGEKLEAVVGIVAIGVLLLVMNWFFHRVYWTEWISSFHKRRRALLARDEDARVAFFSAQVLGLFLLGLSSVYREGFETTLFLQSLELSAGLGPTVAGALLGLAATALVAVITFRLQRKLPYKRMLIVTGVLLAFVLVVMVGATVRTMQGAGWVPIHSIDVDLPYWLGTWLGVFPTWETLGAQVVALAFVIGSYYAAEYVRITRPRRQAALRKEADGAPRPATAAEPER
ncbi:MAG TPA: FTR1 family protein, partial [Solirubrobacterales bacterium]|nr:FTR1 family protein [Solirubrobacterales bacterium]